MNYDKTVDEESFQFYELGFLDALMDYDYKTVKTIRDSKRIVDYNVGYFAGVIMNGKIKEALTQRKIEEEMRMLKINEEKNGK